MGYNRSSSVNLEQALSANRMRTRGESDVERHSRIPYDHDDAAYDISDPNAQNYEQDDDHEPYENLYSPSSPTAESIRAPMLHRAYSRQKNSGMKLRLPPSIMRYACLGVAGMLMMFIVFLVRMSYHSEKQVTIAIIQEKINPKPPVWEEFPFLTRYYGGVRNLVSRSENKPEYPTNSDEGPTDLVPTEKGNSEEKAGQSEDAPAARKRTIKQSVEWDPYPKYTSTEYIEEYGEKVDCFLDENNKITVPRVRVYEAIPSGFPDHAMGSPDLLGMRNDICYDRFGRMGPYGLGYSHRRGGSGAQLAGEREGADLVWKDHPQVDFRKVQWADVQERCNAANAHRFNPLPTPKYDRFRAMKIGANAKRDVEEDESIVATQTKVKPKVSPKAGKSKLPRTAVIIRTWWDYPYTPEDLMYLRSLASELNLLSGGEYSLHFLIQVKEDDNQLWVDDEVYEKILHDALPEEFRGMGTLWTERQMFVLYGGLQETMARGLPVHGVYRSTFMPMQYFAYMHPEYDFFWNWEMDVRNTGQWYHLFDSVSKWAKKQPRKYLWERNSRFYIPSEHGTWEDFSAMVKFQTDQGTNSANNIWSGLRAGGQDPKSKEKQSGDRPIWGPEPPLDDIVAFDDDPTPPTTFEKDKYTWGVGEEADLITFNPLFDPDGTSWLLADDVTGYNITQGRPPRRTAIITASRLSRKLLVTMHKELSKHRHTMFSEMWPASCALHHGLKAVYAPHAEYIDRRWPTAYLEKTFNGGRNGATGGARTSVFGDREHNFRGTTWYYNAGFPEVLWKRWLGLKTNNDGGEVFEMEGEGRMCLPGMLGHPVKRVDLVVEGRMEGE